MLIALNPAPLPLTIAGSALKQWHNPSPAEVLLCSAKEYAHCAKPRADSAKACRVRAAAASKSDVPLKFCYVPLKIPLIALNPRSEEHRLNSSHVAIS